MEGARGSKGRAAAGQGDLYTDISFPSGFQHPPHPFPLAPPVFRGAFALPPRKPILGLPLLGVKLGRGWIWPREAQQGKGRGINPGGPAPPVALSPSRPAGSKWHKRHLTYRVVNWPPYLPQHEVRLAVRAAFELWSNVSSLVFWEARDGPADIRLTFFHGDHNDGLSNAFDGPGAGRSPLVSFSFTTGALPGAGGRPGLFPQALLPRCPGCERWGRRVLSPGPRAWELPGWDARGGLMLVASKQPSLP